VFGWLSKSLITPTGGSRSGTSGVDLPDVEMLAPPGPEPATRPFSFGFRSRLLRFGRVVSSAKLVRYLCSVASTEVRRALRPIPDRVLTCYGSASPVGSSARSTIVTAIHRKGQRLRQRSRTASTPRLAQSIVFRQNENILVVIFRREHTARLPCPPGRLH
jgi:hypothetical protein